MRIDAHHHFWDPGRFHYPWLTAGLARIRRRFGPEDLRPLLAAAGIERSILVQTLSSLEETKELVGIAARVDFIAGVVGWVDLQDPEVGTTLAQLKSAPAGDLLVAIRHQVHDEPDAGWLLRPDVQRGIAAVGEAGLAYEFLVRTRELPAALETARRFPKMRFVIDHIAKPPISSGRAEQWGAAISPFAKLEHVHCKVSGMVTEADWNSWQPADLAPYVESVLGWFGPGRCMFGSDWPVCLLAADYQRVLEALLQALKDLDSAAVAAVMGANAAGFYQLSTVAGSAPRRAE